MQKIIDFTFSLNLIIEFFYLIIKWHKKKKEIFKNTNLHIVKMEDTVISDKSNTQF